MVNAKTKPTANVYPLIYSNMWIVAGVLIKSGSEGLVND
jgi:hypothetical protein